MDAKKPSFFDRFLAKSPLLQTCLQRTKLRDTRERAQVHRTIYINNIKPDEYVGDEPLKYSNNTVVTSKYTILNFLPKNLYEQFRRLANFYFLCNIIVLFFTPEPPKNPITSLIPLVLVILFTAIKQAYEDVLRHKTDAEVNKTPVRVLQDGAFKIIKRKDIKCGDIVEVRTNQSFPCDILLLYCESVDKTCHITTANLDGESNLKLRSVPNKIPVIDNETDLINFRGVIKCDKPNLELYEFKGKIEINKNEYPLRNENVLLRGSTLKIAPVIYGCAIYTGKDTKLMLNSKFKANKLSCIERTLNRFMLFFLCLLALYVLVCFTGSFFFHDLYQNHWYLSGREPRFFTRKVVYYLIEILFYISLFSNIIPISMYISIETQRFIGTKFFEWDLNMYDAKTNQPAKANTSDLNEDLGQIDYLFSDKTGTLTENEMIFKQFSLKNTIYESRNNSVFKLNSDEPVKLDGEEMRKFFECLSLCHTVQLDLSALVKFQASSPDEFSFVKFCEKVDVVFEGDHKVSHSNPARLVRFFGEQKKYDLLHTLDFDSNRKRMSVIVRSIETGQFIVFSKGAEDSIFSKCKTGDTNECDKIISEFARHGWRTLALAFRYLSEDEFKTFDATLNEAYNDITKREEKLQEVFDKIESNLELIGATAVEDRLQEDVAATLQFLRQAGIKVWVLTGDKRETAINISNSCKHFSNEMHKLISTDLNTIDEIKSRLKSQQRQIEHDSLHTSFAYIIDGQTLGKVFKFKLEKMFRNICMECEAVLCCRMSPSQKAQVVKLVKKSKSRPITCSIGDGANDVSMIQEAHIGLGIFGKEGRNAARSADFAFSKFKFVKRALLIHGYLYYTRLTTLVHYFFYKNVTLVTCTLFYAGSTAFSQSSLFHSIFLIFYNIFFTAFPIVAFGIFEQKTKIKKLENNPDYYKSIKHNKLLNIFQFAKWNMIGLWHSAVAYFFTFLFFDKNLGYDGKLDGNVEFGAVVYVQIVIIVHLKLLVEWQSMNYFTIISYSASLLAVILWCLIPSSFIISYPITIITEDQNFFWIFYRILSYPSIWFFFVVTSSAALIPDVCIKIFENFRYEWSLQNQEKLNHLKKMKKMRCLDDVPDNWKSQILKRTILKNKKSMRKNSTNIMVDPNEISMEKIEQSNERTIRF